MGFSFAAAQSLVEDHQINSLEEVRYLQDTEIEGLCNHYNMEDDPAIPNPGILVPVRAERNLKLAAYWLNHQVRVSRAVAEADLTLANIRLTTELRTPEESYMHSNNYPTIDAKNWPKRMEHIEEFLRGRLGEQKFPRHMSFDPTSKHLFD